MCKDNNEMTVCFSKRRPEGEKGTFFSRTVKSKGEVEEGNESGQD